LHSKQSLVRRRVQQALARRPLAIEPSSALRCAIVSLVACFASPAVGNAAEAAPETQLSIAQLAEIVVVATKIATPYMQVAATVTQWDRDDIERSSASDFRDLAKLVPGLSVRRDAARFGLDSFTVRGIGGNRVAVLVDGVPTGKGFAVGSYSDARRPLTELDDVGRVEILRGPASALYGSDAIGGVVGIVTLQPSDVLQDGASSWAGNLKTSYTGSSNESRATANVAAALGPVAGLLSFTHRDSSELETTGSVAPNPRDATSDALSAKLVWDEAPGGRLRVGGSTSKTQVATSVDSLLGVARFASTTRLLGDDTVEVRRAVVDQALSFDAAERHAGEWRIYWTETDTKQATDEYRRPSPAVNYPQRLAREFTLETSLLGAALTASHRVGDQTLQQNWVYGIDASRATIRELRDGSETNLTTLAVRNVLLGETLPVRDFPNSRLWELGAYVQNQVRWRERWSLIPALRYDYYDLTAHPDAVYLEDNRVNKAVDITQHSFSPKLGLVFELNERVSYFAQYAHGFRSPPFEDVNIGLDVPTQNIRAKPNPDLQPERSDGYELGARLVDASLRANLTLFYNDYRNFIVSKVNIGTNLGVTEFQSQNIDRARIYGAEADLRISLAAWSDALADWRVDVAAMWSRGENAINRQPLNSVEPPLAILAVNYQAPSLHWSAALSATTVAAKTKADDSKGLQARTAGYTTVDSRLHLRIHERVDIDIALLNIFDRSYQVWADVQGRLATDPQLPLLYQAGRSASLTAKWKL